MSQPDTRSPFSANEWLGLALGAWLIAALLFYLFGLHGPFGRYSLVVLLAGPGYLSYKAIAERGRGDS